MRDGPRELPPLTEADVTHHVDILYKPDIILLGGSRAQGTAQLDSDWDLYLIGSFPENERYPQIYRGADLDVAVYPAYSVTDQVLRIYFGPVSTLKVLKDNASQHGQAIVIETRKAFERGPDVFSSDERERRLHELGRLVRKAEAHINTPLSAMTDLAHFYLELVPLWFALRGEWSRPLRTALDYIQAKDSAFVQLLHQWSATNDMKTRVEVSTSLVMHLSKAEAG